MNTKMWKEAQTYGDIQFMPFVDYYSLISLKTIAICIFGVSFNFITCRISCKTVCLLSPSMMLKTEFYCIFHESQTNVLPAKYLMKTDDDAFVRIDEVLSSLKGKKTKGLVYGLIAFTSEPDRDKDSKWYISDEVVTTKFIFRITSSISFQ